MSVEQPQSHLWTSTPLIFSSHLSTRLGKDEYAVYLKLEVRACSRAVHPHFQTQRLQLP